MKLAVGYQQRPDEPLTEIIRRHASDIGEVYFAWPGEPSGRMPLGLETPAAASEIQARLEADLAVFRELGIRLNLLFNASCYGGLAVSVELADRVCRITDDLSRRFGLAVVTTCSPMIARLVKDHFPGIATRASVNMRIGTIEGASALDQFFDEYVIQREFNRDLDHIAEFSAWCRQHGKKLEILVNSGCMAFCPGQTFHDNLVAHEVEACRVPNIDFDPVLCHHVYLDPANWDRILRSTWIRPEDLGHYEPWFDQVKLATRMHKDPEMVVKAYAGRSFDGDLLDLLEPGHGPMLGGRWIDNSLFPEKWFEKTTSCGRKCHACNYCANVFKRVIRSAWDKPASLAVSAEHVCCCQ